MGENTVDPQDVTGTFASFPYQDDLVDARKLVSPPASKEAAMTLALIDIAYTLREIRQILINK